MSELPTRQETVWEALPGSQTLFLSCPVREILYEGTRGPGKTDSLIVKFLMNVNRGFGMHWRGVIFRREYKDLADIMLKAKVLIPRVFPGAVFLKAPGDLKWVFPDGAELMFRNFKTPDDYWTYHGQELPFIAWEELTAWPNDACFDTMVSCNRSSCVGIPIYYISTTNPYGPGHSWVKKRYIDPAEPGEIVKDEWDNERVRIFGHIDENPFLPESYVRLLKSTKDPNKRKAWVEGSWEITSGGMFDDLWRDEIHKVPPFEIPNHWIIDRAFDWGSSKPFAVNWFAESDGCDVFDNKGNFVRHTQPGDLFTISELYGWTGEPNVGVRWTAGMIAQEIKKYEDSRNWCQNYSSVADSAIFTIQNGNCIATDMEAEGIYFQPANKAPGTRKQGWQMIRNRLLNSITKEGPGFYVFSTCRQTLRTLPSLPRCKRDPDDVDTEAEDHIADEIRYRCLKSSFAVSTTNL